MRKQLEKKCNFADHELRVMTVQLTGSKLLLFFKIFLLRGGFSSGFSKGIIVLNIHTFSLLIDLTVTLTVFWRHHLTINCPIILMTKYLQK